MTQRHITKCEAEVMEVVWDRQRVTVADVVEAIDRDLAYTTVLTTMRILEEKGIVRRGEKAGRAHTYLAAVTRDEVRKGMIHELTNQLFGGSVRSLVLSLIDSDDITPEDIAAVKKAAARAERRK
jgi:predicted transcriptional regulator